MFLRPEDVAEHAGRVIAGRAERLPTAFRGHPTHFGPTGEPGIAVMTPSSNGPVDHRVEVTDLRTGCRSHLGFDPVAGVTLLDWFSTPTQRLAEATGGAVFRDDLGSALVAARLSRDLLRLRLLLHRRYPPYGKWLGSAHAALPDQVGARSWFRRPTRRSRR